MLPDSCPQASVLYIAHRLSFKTNITERRYGYKKMEGGWVVWSHRGGVLVQAREADCVLRLCSFASQDPRQEGGVLFQSSSETKVKDVVHACKSPFQFAGEFQVHGVEIPVRQVILCGAPHEVNSNQNEPLR